MPWDWTRKSVIAFPSSSEPGTASMLACRGVTCQTPTSVLVAFVQFPKTCTYFDLESDGDPACRSISLKGVRDPTVFPKALAISLNALKGLLDPVCELLGVKLVAAASIDREPNSG